MSVDPIAMCWERAGITTVTIRDVPEDLHEILKLRAKRMRRSANQEVIAERVIWYFWSLLLS